MFTGACLKRSVSMGRVGSSNKKFSGGDGTGDGGSTVRRNS